MGAEAKRTTRTSGEIGDPTQAQPARRVKAARLAPAAPPDGCVSTTCTMSSRSPWAGPTPTYTYGPSSSGVGFVRSG